MITLYDAARCPYCARVRIVLAEKGLEHEVGRDRPRRPAGLALREEPARQGAGDRGGRVRPARVVRDHGVPRGALPGAGAAPGRPGRARARAAPRLSLRRRCSATTTTPRGAAEREPPRASGWPSSQVGRSLVSGHRLRALGDPRPRPARHRASGRTSTSGWLERSPSGRRSRPSSRPRRRAPAMRVALLHALPFDERMWEPQLPALDGHEVHRAEPVRPRLEHGRVGARRAPAGAGPARRRRRLDGRLLRLARSRGWRPSASPGSCSSARAPTPTRPSARRSARNGSASPASRAARGSGRPQAKSFFGPAASSRRWSSAPTRIAAEQDPRGARPRDRGDPRPARLDRGGDERDPAARRRGRGRRAAPGAGGRRELAAASPNGRAEILEAAATCRAWSGRTSSTGS